jgi:hypothetical protein
MDDASTGAPRALFPRRDHDGSKKAPGLGRSLRPDGPLSRGRLSPRGNEEVDRISLYRHSFRRRTKPRGVRPKFAARKRRRTRAPLGDRRLRERIRMDTREALKGSIDPGSHRSGALFGVESTLRPLPSRARHHDGAEVMTSGPWERTDEYAQAARRNPRRPGFGPERMAMSTGPANAGRNAPEAGNGRTDASQAERAPSMPEPSAPGRTRPGFPVSAALRGREGQSACARRDPSGTLVDRGTDRFSQSGESRS